MRDDYDVVIIGSGIGGLSCALSLINAGKHVLVLEQHNLPGGCATSFVRGRFEFDASLHELCALGHPGNWGFTGKIIMEDFKLPISWYYVDELYRVIATARSGKKYDITLPTGIDAIIDRMEKYVPGSRKAMTEFFSLAKECYEASEYFDNHMWDKKKSNGNIAIKTSVFIKHFFRYILVAERPFNEVLHRINMPEDAIDILNTYWVYQGSDLNELSFVSMAVMIYAYATMQPAIPHHTSHAISVEAIEKIRQAGSDVYMNVKATKVVSDDHGNIIGVDTTVGFVPCKNVVGNINPATAYGQLLDKRIKIPKREQKKVNAVSFSTRFVNVYLGLNKSHEELGINNYTIFCPGDLDASTNLEASLSMDNISRCTMVCYNVVYPDCSPKGTTILSLTIPFPTDNWANVNPRDYVKAKEKVAMKAIHNFEQQTGIIVSPYIEEIEIATPWTFAHYLGTPQGTVYGKHNTKWNSMVSQLLGIRNDHPIKGFKTVGASGARGAGYSQSFCSGKDIANLVLEEMKGGKKHHGK